MPELGLIQVVNWRARARFDSSNLITVSAAGVRKKQGLLFCPSRRKLGNFMRCYKASWDVGLTCGVFSLRFTKALAERNLCIYCQDATWPTTLKNKVKFLRQLDLDVQLS